MKTNHSTQNTHDLILELPSKRRGGMYPSLSYEEEVEWGAPCANTGNRGISLLVVVLIGSIMLIAATALGTFALRSLQNSQTRADATQGIYSAEDAFACVKYWLQKNAKAFTANPTDGSQIECEGVTYNFKTNSPTATNGTTPTYGLYSGTSIDFDGDGTSESNVTVTTFTLPGNTKVEVIRNMDKPNSFDGRIRVYGRNAGDTSSKQAERYQEYSYATIQGADIMFVIDRSGSIGGSRNSQGQLQADASGEWANLVWALADSVSYFSGKVPQPMTGIVSFGKDVQDVGQPVDENGALCTPGTYPCYLIPDIPLTGESSKLPDNGGDPSDPKDGTNLSPQDDTLAGMRTEESATNLSLGLAVAGAELMRKYYPAGGSSAPALADSGNASGLFEKLALTDPTNFPSGLKDHTTNERPEYGNYIILITDGEPNGIITFTGGTYDSGEQVSEDDPTFNSPAPKTYNPGDTLLFRVGIPGRGYMVSEDEYTTCYDGALDTPAGLLLSISNQVSYGKDDVDEQTTFPSDVFSRVPMCNAKLIADALKAQGIRIGVIGVAVRSATEDFLKEDIASPELGYVSADSYGDVYNAIDKIIRQLILLESK